jgi:TolA-binding protein
MAFFRQWLLVWFALVLGGGPLVAAGTREDRAYAAAVEPFNDHFYDRAESGLTQFLQTYHKSTNAPMAVLLLAQAEFFLGKYSAAGSRLADTNNLAAAQAAGLADRYVYWRAEAQFGAGDFSSAAQTFVSVPEKFPDSPLAVNAVVEAAAAFGKLSEWPRADELLARTNGVFQRAAQLDPADEVVANGRLLQAESKFSQTNFAAAIQILDRLNPATLTPEQDWKRASQLYHAQLGLHNFDAVLAATTNLTQIALHGQGEIWATNLAQSVAWRADVLEKQGRLADASAAWQENLTNTVPVGLQQQAVLKMAELAAAQSNLTNAEAGLEKFLAQYPDAPAAEIALLKLGGLYLDEYLAQPAATNRLGMAQAKFDQFLAASTNGPLAGKAFLGRGWCFWLAGRAADDAGDTNVALQKITNSLADFTQAAEQLGVSEDLAVARFKMGDAQFALNDFAAAQTNYQAVLTDFAAQTNVFNALGDRALYQILRAQLARHDVAGAEETMAQLLDKFFNSSAAESGQWLAGEGFSDFGSPAKARAVFRKFEIQRADSPLLPRVAFAAGRTFEREQNWPAAVTSYQNWLKAYPTNELRPQVEYSRDWAVAQTGDEVRAFALFTNFISGFPTNALTPLAHWWVADHYFRLGGTNYVDAEKDYELIFQDFPTNELAYPAQLMAGRAALGRFGYPDASGYFVKVINATNCPEDLRVQARFGYCEALEQMSSAADTNGYLQTATNILAQLTPMAATNVAGALAWSEIGDCNLQLGALDAATNAYAQVFDPNSPASALASQELRNRAQVGLGIVLEKQAEGLTGEARSNLLNQAMKYYEDVFYSEADTKDAFWTKKAGMQMLALAVKTGSLKGEALAGFVKKLKTLFPQLQDSAELKRFAVKN